VLYIVLLLLLLLLPVLSWRLFYVYIAPACCMHSAVQYLSAVLCCLSS
jgi:hypothetical protein